MIRIGVFLRNPDRGLEVAEKLQQSPDLVVSIIAHNTHDAVTAAATTKFDVSITGEESMEDAAVFRSKTRADLSFISKRLFITDRISAGKIIQGVHTGFDNYLLWNDPLSVWVDTITKTLHGESSLRADSLWKVAGDPVDMTKLQFEERPDIDKDIVELLSEGLTNDQIAEVLHLSCQTVRNKVCRLMDDIGVSNRTLLSLAYRRSTISWKSNAD